MKVKLIHHSFEWLSGDFEAPESLSGERYLAAWRIHHDHRAGLIGMKLDKVGAGVWNSEGKLLFFDEEGADLAWYNDSTNILNLENRWGPCQKGDGISHVLKRLAADSFRTQ